LATLEGHSTEGVQTIISALRELKVKMEKATPDIDVQSYDLQNSLLCSLLESILVNTQNVDSIVKLNGISDIARIMQEQPMPSELEG